MVFIEKEKIKGYDFQLNALLSKFTYKIKTPHYFSPNYLLGKHTLDLLLLLFQNV